MQDPTHGYRISDFSSDDIAIATYLIQQSTNHKNPMDYIAGYIEGLMFAESSNSDTISPYIVLLDIFWSYLHQGGHEHTTPGHIVLAPYTTSDVCLEFINYVIDKELMDMDELFDFINSNIRS